MLNILIVDDNQNKIKAIRALIDKIPEVSSLETATNIISAKKILVDNHFDLLILDLGLPVRDGDDANPENGINFLDDINKSKRLIKPFHIIGLSAVDEYIDKFQRSFEDELWALIKYEESSSNWERQIINKINYLIKSKMDLQNPNNFGYQFDLAIITALRSPELDSILGLAADWESFTLDNDSTEYYKGIFTNDEKKIKVITASAPQMGMVASSSLTQKIIHNFRPKYIAMTGIAGGVKGVGNLGDILIADITFDSGSGKIKSDLEGGIKFEPDFKSIELDTDLKEMFISCKGKREFLNEIKSKWPIKDITHELNIHIGPFASGAGVVQNKKVIEEIKGHSRKLIGIDMETYGVFYASKNCSRPKPIAAFSIKSISDFGDQDKNDNFQPYAAYTSANFLHQFIVNKLEFDL
jgi:nucleoside phosphorylase/CheY-like chemotaxis protein